VIGFRKYRNVPIEVDGVRFASKKEARRWGELQLLQRANVIADLKRQVSFKLAVNDVPICTYIADFTYLEGSGEGLTVEDTKGVLTPEFKLKSKLMKAVHGIDVRIS
jgi:hypothetical protein